MKSIPRRLEGKTALVTGAASGIGRAVAIRFAQEGADVAVNYRGESGEAEAVVAEVRALGVRGIAVRADVSKEVEVKKMFEWVISVYDQLDILVNNAGIQKLSPSHELSLADLEEVLAVDLRGPFLCSREAIRHFLARGGGGVIVNNSSVHEIIPRPTFLSYAMAKGGLGNLTRTLALEYADRGIRINAVGPGAIATPINQHWTDDAKAKAEVVKHIPMGRVGEAAEIAAVFAFLASDEASYVTGQTLYACGGLTLYPEFRQAWSSGD